MRLFRRLFGRTTVEVVDDSTDPEKLRLAIGDRLIEDLIKERRSERNWKHIKRIFVSGSAVVIFGVYVSFYVTSLGYHIVPNSDIVGVVRITRVHR